MCILSLRDLTDLRMTFCDLNDLLVTYTLKYTWYGLCGQTYIIIILFSILSAYLNFCSLNTALVHFIYAVHAYCIIACSIGKNGCSQL